MTAKQIAQSIPSEYREKILTQWLPGATADMSNPSMQKLFNAYYIYVEPGKEGNTNCPRCVRNVLENWQHLTDALKEAELNYQLLNQI